MKLVKRQPMTDQQRELVVQWMRLAFRLVNSMNIRKQDREDAAQDALVQMCKASYSFDPSRGKKFSTYVGRAVMQGAARGRKRWHRREFTTNEPSIEVAVAPPEETSLFSAEQIERAVQSLKPRMRRLLRLRYGLDGETPHSNSQLASLLGLTPAAASARVKYARKMLACALEQPRPSRRRCG